MPILGSLDLIAPVLTRAYHQAARAETGQRMTRIAERALAFCKAMNNHWPRDIADLRAWARDLPNEAFISAGHPELVKPFCYVPPAQSIAEQPVLIQDPAGNDGFGSLVVYANGKLGYVSGTALWLDAQRLVALPKAREAGIDLEDWTALPKTY